MHLLTKIISQKKHPQKGSAILLVIVTTVTITLITSSLLKWGIVEQTLNNRHIIRSHGQNAVESILESGVAQLVNRWNSESSFIYDELAPSKSPLTISKNLINLYSGTDLDIQEATLLGGPVSEGVWKYIDPTDPQNEFDPQKGKRVYIRKVNLLSKIVGNIPQSNPITVYGKQTLEIRDAPLLTHAVFYNMDLEYHPGPNMDMYGPVHSNGNIYTSANNNLYFHSTVTTAKDYFHGLAPLHPEGAQSGTVWIKNPSGKFISDYKGSGSKTDNTNYYDSNTANWREIASNRWGGNLQTKDHGVPYQNPVGYKDYVRDDPTTPELDDDLNYAYAIIEPNLKVKNKINHPNYKGAGENEKFARKAGLIIRLHESTESPTKLSYKLSNNYYVSFHKIKRTNDTNPNSAVAVDENGYIEEVDIAIDANSLEKVLNMQEYTENSLGTPTSGLYDQRRGEGISTLEFNIENFRKWVDNTSSDYDPSVWESNYSPSADYNGAVYFEFPIDNSLPERPDKIVTSKDKLGLLVKNADTIPNPSYNNTATRDSGFNLATNTTLYVKGHFNADGKSSTGSATEPDSSSNPEPPALLAADAITFLSNNWLNETSKTTQTSLRKATFTEFNAALIQGIVPTGKGGAKQQSGGNHNFPRFLEDWGGQTFRYRGSHIVLFESEIANDPHSNFYYNAPKRDWGYYKEFSNGKFPPASPNVRSFKKSDFRFINKETYLSLTQEIHSVFNEEGEASYNKDNDASSETNPTSETEENTENNNSAIKK